MSSIEYPFPEDFLWGTATSAYQIEGYNFNNDWYIFEQNPNNITNGEKAGIATDHWNRYEEDYNFLEGMNVNSYRLSIEWSRIYPKKDKINQQALKHYENMLKSLKKRKIKIMLNLHHFTIPLWFVDKGGFEHTENIRYFDEYTHTIAQRFREYVDIWCTINEPIVVAVNGFLNKEFPPKKTSLSLAFKVGKNLMRMHASAYKIIKESNPTSMVGFVKHTPLFQPLTKHWGDRLRAKYANYMYIKSIFHSIKTGRMPFSFFKNSNLKNSLDYIGINYYSRMLASKKYFPQIYHGAPPNADPQYLCAGLGWQPYPAGLYTILKYISKIFPDKPIFIAENGIGTNNDEWRQYNLISHLLEVKRALIDGMNIIGFHYWSLTDNWEWNHGFGPRFGLVHVDYDDLRRTIKDSGILYAKICKNNGLSLSDINEAVNKFPNIDKTMRLRTLEVHGSQSGSKGD
ncbi:MAG: glycoside hydrolase family 1 protein [Candidatus Thorarchaeota archaeon]